MELNRFFKTSASALIIAVAALTGCDDTQPTVIEIDQSALPRTAWADETQGSQQVAFVAPAAWTSSVADAPAAKAATGASSVKAATGNWVSISPESGQAGANSVTVTLLPNYTGEPRSATVTITSGEVTASFVITQDGKKEDGTVPEDPDNPAIPDNLLTFDGQARQIVRTEFHPARQWVTDDPSVNTWLHEMRFYTSSGSSLELLLVTGSETFAGGAFTFGDLQVNNMNKATGAINLLNEDGTTSRESLAWGPELRVVRSSDNMLTVEFNKVPTDNTKREVSLTFGGLYENTETPDEFVSVQRIAFPDGHPLTTLKADLNTVHSLTDATVQPVTATAQDIEWTVTGAPQNGSFIIFNQAGTVTITATIDEGMLGADGTKTAYTQSWKVEVGDGDNTGNVITVDGQAYPVVKTDLGMVQEWFTDDPATSAWLQMMRFYASDDFYVELSLVTNSRTFSGGAFAFGDIQINNMNKAAGSVYMPDAAGAMTQEQFEWGPELRAMRASDNMLTVDFNKVPTRNTKKEVSLHFSGLFENTETPEEFVPVRNIVFPDDHALTVLKADLNTTYQLSEAAVQPNTATNQGIKWAAEGAVLNGLTLIFDRAGTATVTATISEGMLGADGTKTTYTQSWTVTVGDPTPEKVITFDGNEHPILGVDYRVDQWANGSYGHRIKFSIGSSLGVDIEFATADKDLTAGEYLSTGGDTPADGQALIFLNFTTDDGVDYVAAGGKVRVVRNDDGTFRVEFMSGVTTLAGLPIYMLYVGDFTE